MDIYDKMCFTVSSAGGRRGAQMGTFDVGHPDAMEFIRAKRENGRLRQFNLSLLVTDDFMKAVRADTDWNLAFPLLTKEYDPAEHKLDDATKFVWREWPTTKNYVTREDGLVCCKIYKTLPARRMWDVIMTSTYDFAEPGFILIDRVNEMNNNWWCENIRATNPCVTADTWVQTSEGPRQVAELIGKPFTARVDGVDHASAPEGFFRTARQAAGEPDDVRRAFAAPHVRSPRAPHLHADAFPPGDRVVRRGRSAARATGAAAGSSHSAASWAGALGARTMGANEGYLMGLLVGDGTIAEDRAELSIWARPAVGNSDIDVGGPHSVMAAALDAARCFNHRADFSGWHQGTGRGEFRLGMGAITELSRELGLRPGRQTITPAIERASSEFYRGFLRGLFDTDGSVQGNQTEGRVGAPRAVRPRPARRRAAHAAASRHRLQHVRARAARARHHRRERRPIRGSRGLRRHGQARAPRAPAGRLQAHAQSRALRRHGRERRVPTAWKTCTTCRSPASTNSMPMVSTRTTAASSRCRRMARACSAR